MLDVGECKIFNVACLLSASFAQKVGIPPAVSWSVVQVEPRKAWNKQQFPSAAAGGWFRSNIPYLGRHAGSEHLATSVYKIYHLSSIISFMRLWLSKSSEVPLREQLVTQIILGIASNDLVAGERLPSTRELARRYKIHANTVSAAYRELAKRGWVEFRRGSGIYILSRNGMEQDASQDLDAMIAGFLKNVQAKGYSLADIEAGMKRWSLAQPPDHFLLVEPDDELRRILAAEIAEATGRRVVGANVDDLKADGLFTGAIIVAMHTHADAVRTSLPVGMELVALHSQSVPESMHGQRVPPRDALIAVVSRWSGFLQRARTVLVAAGLEPEALAIRDAKEAGWDHGLKSTAFVITDSLMADQLPVGCTARVFRIVSDASLSQLQAHAGKMIQ